MSTVQIIEELPRLTHVERREIARRLFELEEEVQILADADQGANENFLTLDALRAQLAADIAGTANNIPGVAILGLSISSPPQQSEVQPLADKVDELINTLRRA